MTWGNERRIARTCGEIFAASSKEMVEGMVARTQSAPSSRWGMNSAPMPGTSRSEPASRSAETTVVAQGWRRQTSSPRV